jgi:hypothetical protein
MGGRSVRRWGDVQGINPSTEGVVSASLGKSLLRTVLFTCLKVYFLRDKKPRRVYRKG